ACRQHRHACLNAQLHSLQQPNRPPILVAERRIARRDDIPIRGQSMTTWLLVSGDFTPLGGMDRANHALAKYIGARRDADIHLVTHRAWDDLTAMPDVTVHRVWRPLNYHAAGMPLLARAGQ